MDLIVLVKSTTKTMGRREEKQKKIHKQLQTSQNIRIINVFLSLCCQCPFPRWDSQSPSPP